MPAWSTSSAAQVQTPSAQEERQRLARDLHDSVAQLLYGIALEAAAAGRACHTGRIAQAEQGLADIQEDARQALCEIRLLICDLDPPRLAEAGLAAALAACLSKLEQRAGLRTELAVQGVGRLPSAIEADLYRIVLEALSNLTRHAHARQAWVRLGQSDHRLWVEVRDDGCGFDISTAPPGGGLATMQARAERLGGTLRIESEMGLGTTVRVEIPQYESFQ